MLTSAVVIAGKLLNLRKRMARIRVFDPACGSGNFLVIAYKQMRAIEAEINSRRGEEHLRSEIPLTNFRGIELRDFPAEIARLALIIAEFQCDVLYRGQQDALAEFLPLDTENWIVSGNALRLDWLSICPPTGTGVKVVSDDLFNTPLDQKEIDFENEGGETYICGNLFLDFEERARLLETAPQAREWVLRFSNSEEFINGKQRFCIWLNEDSAKDAVQIPELKARIEKVRQMRLESPKKQTQAEADTPYRFSEIRHRPSKSTIVVPRVSSENRPYLPVGVIEGGTVVGDRNFALYDAPLWNMALIASRLHWVWIGAVCVRLEMRFSYSNTLGWNTFPLPVLTEQNKADLTNCAQAILLAREAHFPSTIADLYDPETMPDNLRMAHERNDEVIERIYIGRRFKNDTERLEKLFELYTKMTADTGVKKKGKKA